MKRHIHHSPSTLIVFTTSLVLFASTAALAASGNWVSAGNVHTARDGHTATLLSNGNVVIAGGENNNQALDSTEVYSSMTGQWTYSGNLNVARSNHGAVLLPNGSILVAGGCTGGCLGATTASAELYNSVSGKWASTGSMLTARTYFGMAMEAGPGGRVLVAGGCTGLNSNGCTGVTARVEYYNPATGKWAALPAMHVARGSLSATLLRNGQILVAGGINAAGNPIASAELFNPATGKWTLTATMNVARDEHTAILLASGNVLVAGGEGPNGSTAKSEIYNPSTGKWALSGNLNTARQEHTATLLMNGNVLIAGGNYATANQTIVLSSAEIYNASTGTWSKTGSMANARVGHSATLLPSGNVLAASGSNANNDLVSCEVYTP